MSGRSLLAATLFSSIYVQPTEGAQRLPYEHKEDSNVLDRFLIVITARCGNNDNDDTIVWILKVKG